MARQYTITMMPNGQGWKPEVTPSDAAAAAPGVNEMSIGYADDVETHRTLEMHNGWRWLWNGVRDRNLLDVQFVGSLLLTGANINSLTESNRRTSSDILDFATGDVWIGVGAGVSTGAIGRSANQMLDSGFRMLREYAKENP
jgi:hypothetical protein